MPAEPSAPSTSSGSLGLRAGVLWTFGGQLTYAAAQWAMVAVLAHLGTPSTVGSYALGLALTSPLFLMLGLQLRSVQATDARNDTPFGQYVSLRVLCMIAALVLTGVLALLYPQAWAVIGWLGLAKALEGLSDVCYGRMQQRERLDVVARSTMLRGVLSLVLLVGLFAWSHSVGLSTAGVALANLLVLIGYDIPQVRRLTPGPYFSRVVPPALIRLAWPLGAVVGLVSLSSTIPRLVLDHSSGSHLVGIYSALIYVNVAGSVVVVAIGTALTARLSQFYAADNRAGFVRLTLQFTGAAAAVGLSLTAVALLAGRPLLNLLYGPEYADQTAAFVWLMASGALGYLASCAGFAVTAARRFIQQLPLFLVVCAVLLVCCWWLIPAHGLVGAAIAALIAAAVQLVGSWFIVLGALNAPALHSGSYDTTKS
ncbi:lipopolysaccharide biosynthesis protein (plasmid) [Deinococcus sp. KNUC1210]|uniref:lipopolysaccharide biosynthesis protein n=1 Tax=Deinococcus sp. KNUC1210 TaxID=2917691 RepID=UPI001EEF9914|nr:lipopolysaccharide biosynthesis protein [Deinococcus sp. KNUC1210]ULH13893.1 lipopolysaccharide biosynthesis protein [Deinococcus sp. KNUC1210]